MENLLGIFGCHSRNPGKEDEDVEEKPRLVMCAALDCTERSGKRGENASHERRGVLTSPLRKTGAEARATETINTPNGDNSVGGIGLVFKAGPIGSGPLVKGIVPGGSADIAGGVVVGDQLAEVDGENVKTLPAADLAGRLIGPVGSKITMTFIRTNDEDSTPKRFEVCMIRQRKKPKQ